ncbi:MAG TPA: DUF4124 domain-containing protein [Candidatus Competibacter sp.]|nr:DUF4124 domain-containing protein [Candidatus Competibacter sp.]
MHIKRPTSLLAAIALVPMLSVADAQQIYKWTDASGKVHYGEKKPDDTAQVQTLDVAPSPPAAPPNADSAAEIARINALSQQMAREREAAEQARQEQAIRDLEQENQRLKNDLLNQQQQQQNNDNNGVVVEYPPPYPPYPPYPPQPYPPRPWPCQPWPDCHKPPPPPPEPSKPPITKPRPSFHPKSVGVDSTPQGAFRGR